jgi:hypothetical protein
MLFRSSQTLHPRLRKSANINPRHEKGDPMQKTKREAIRLVLSTLLILVCLVTVGYATSRTFGGVSTDAVTVTQHAGVNDITTLSVSVWTYRTGAGGNNIGRMLDKIGAGSTGWMLYTSNAGTDQFQANDWDGTDGIWNWPTPSNDAWHHTCVTYDGGSTANDPIVKIDGVDVTETEVAAPTGTNQADANNLVIGNNSAGTRNWAGSLAHAAVWNVILTGAECAQLAGGVDARRIRSSALVFYLPLHGDDSPELNYASRANTGTVTGTVKNASGPYVSSIAQ